MDVKKIGTVMPKMIAFMAFPNPKANIMMQKIDLSNGYWQMIVEDGTEYNFIYLLSKQEDKPQQVMVPSQLVMGWTESAAFFTTASQGAADLAIIIIITEPETMTHLGPHPLEHHAIPPRFETAIPSGQQQTKNNPAILPEIVDSLLTVFIDDFCHLLAILVEPTNEITIATQAILHSIHAIFPPTHITGHIQGKDPISIKRLEKGNAQWEWTKEILGFLFDGLTRTIKLPADKAQQYLHTITTLTKQSMSIKAF